MKNIVKCVFECYLLLYVDPFFIVYSYLKIEKKNGCNQRNRVRKYLPEVFVQTKVRVLWSIGYL